VLLICTVLCLMTQNNKKIITETDQHGLQLNFQVIQCSFKQKGLGKLHVTLGTDKVCLVCEHSLHAHIVIITYEDVWCSDARKLIQNVPSF
jgi:hypothetical protein